MLHGGHSNYLFCEEHDMKKFVKFPMYQKEHTAKNKCSKAKGNCTIRLAVDFQISMIYDKDEAAWYQPSGHLYFMEVTIMFDPRTILILLDIILRVAEEAEDDD